MEKLSHGLASEGAGGNACLRQPSRSATITSNATSSGLSSPSAQACSSDDDQRVLSQLKHWIALDLEIERLQNRWARLEGQALNESTLKRLGAEDPKAIPYTMQLKEIDDRIDILIEERDGLLLVITDAARPTIALVVARLAAAKRLVWADDHPEAHAMIERAHIELLGIVGKMAN